MNAAPTCKLITTAMAMCRPNQSPNSPPPSCPSIIPASKEELHDVILDESSGGCVDCMRTSAKEMLTVLYAAEKLDTIERRTSALVELRLCRFKFVGWVAPCDE